MRGRVSLQTSGLPVLKPATRTRMTAGEEELQSEHRTEAKGS